MYAKAQTTMRTSSRHLFIQLFIHLIIFAHPILVFDEFIRTGPPVLTLSSRQSSVKYLVYKTCDRN